MSMTRDEVLVTLKEGDIQARIKERHGDATVPFITIRKPYFYMGNEFLNLSYQELIDLADLLDNVRAKLKELA